MKPPAPLTLATAKQGDVLSLVDAVEYPGVTLAAGTLIRRTGTIGGGVLVRVVGDTGGPYVLDGCVRVVLVETATAKADATTEVDPLQQRQSDVPLLGGKR